MDENSRNKLSKKYIILIIIISVFLLILLYSKSKKLCTKTGGIRGLLQCNCNIQNYNGPFSQAEGIRMPKHFSLLKGCQ